MKLRQWLKKYSHSWVFLYWLIYLPWFGWLEHTVTTKYHIIQSVFDPYVPFCEAFVVPYLLWFPYVALVIGWFFFHDKKDFYRLTVYLYTGMTIFLLVCTVYPNGLALRPDVLPRDNMCTRLVQMLWAVDTPTNVLPSLHVYNSVVCCTAVFQCEALREKRLLRFGTAALTVSIILSTMFLKQHSMVDVSCALVMAWLLYPVAYHRTVPVRRRQLVRDI